MYAIRSYYAILAAEKGYNRLIESIELSEKLKASEASSLDIKQWKQSCYDAMNDDFNTPILIAQLFEGIRFVNLIHDGKETLKADDIEILRETLTVFVFDVLRNNFV